MPIVTISSFTGYIFGFQSGKIIITSNDSADFEVKITFDNSSLTIADKDGKTVTEIVFQRVRKKQLSILISWMGYEQEMSTKIKSIFTFSGAELTNKSKKSMTIKAGIETQKINISDYRCRGIILHNCTVECNKNTIK